MSAVLIIFVIVILSALGYLLFLYFTGKLLPQQPQQPPQQAQQPPAPKNMCNRGPQSKLNNRTCKEIADLSFSDGVNPGGFTALFGNPNRTDSQFKALGLNNWKQVGNKYKGEDCWYEPLGNCTSPDCIKDDTNGVDENFQKCYLQYKANIIKNMSERDKFNALVDPSILGPFNSNNAPPPKMNFKFW